MVDFGKSDKMRKVSRKLDKANTDNEFSNDILSLLSEEVFRIKTKYHC